MTLHNLPIFSEPPPLCEGKDLIFLAIALYIITSSTGVLGFSSQAWLPSWPHTAWEKVNRKLEQARRSICLKEWIKIDAMVVLIDLVFCQVKSEKKKKKKIKPSSLERRLKSCFMEGRMQESYCQMEDSTDYAEPSFWGMSPRRQLPGVALCDPVKLLLCKYLPVMLRLRWHFWHGNHMLRHIKFFPLAEKWNRKTSVQPFA